MFSRGRLDHKDLRDKEVRTVNQDHQVNVENLDLKDHRVHRVQADSQDQEESAENLDLEDNPDKQDHR